MLTLVVVFFGLPLLLVTAMFSGKSPRAVINRVWGVALVSLVVVCLLGIVRYWVTAYLNVAYLWPTPVVSAFLSAAVFAALGVGAERLRAAWKTPQEERLLTRTILVTIVLWCITPPFPTEEVLRLRFAERRAEFDQLIRMVREDNPRSVRHNPPALVWDLEGAASAGLLSPQRVAAYHRVLHRIGRSPFLFVDNVNQTISLSFPSTGVGEGLKGYQYSYGAHAPHPSAFSLDFPWPQGHHYRHLEGRWYLFDSNLGMILP